MLFRTFVFIAIAYLAWKNKNTIDFDIFHRSLIYETDNLFLPSYDQSFIMELKHGSQIFSQSRHRHV